MHEHRPIDSHITFLEVSDIEQSHRFYASQLGLSMVLDQGGCRIYRMTDTAFLGVCEKPGDHESNVVVTIVTADVDGWHRQLTEAGVQTDGVPRDNPDYRIYHFYSSDPDGHTIEVQRFWDEDWDRPQPS